jgi:hypothetical protein
LAQAFGVGVQSAHMEQAAHAVLLARFDDALGKLDVRAREGLAVGLSPSPLKNSHEVDDGVAPGGEARERFRVVYVGLDHVHGRQEYEVFGALAPASGNRNVVPVFDELAHKVPADEAAAADDHNATHGETRSAQRE